MANVSPLQTLEQVTTVPPGPQPTCYSIQQAGWRYLLRQSVTALPLIVGDAAACIATTAVVYAGGWTLYTWSLPLAATFCLCALLLAMLLMGHYPGIGTHPAVEMRRQILVIAALSGCLVIAVLLNAPIRAAWLAGPIALGIGWCVTVPTARSLVRTLCRRFNWWRQSIVFVGSASEYSQFKVLFDTYAGCGLRLIGFFGDSRQQWLEGGQTDAGLLGDFDELAEFARDNQIYWVLVGETVDETEDLDVDERIVGIPHRLYRRTGGSIPNIWESLLFVDGEILIHQTDRLLLPHNRVIKRLMDVVLGGLIAILAIPLFLLVALLMKLTSRGTVFYRSPRIGRDSEQFTMTKFRTMRRDADEYLKRYFEKFPDRQLEWNSQHKLTDDPRVTRFGNLLRRTSLDELPQIFDVLAGKMSLVGPRPILVSEAAMYGPHFQNFCRMLPGMTGLWQVSGRNRVSYDKRLDLVSYYVQNWSPWLDLYLLAKTAKVVITGDGAI